MQKKQVPKEIIYVRDRGEMSNTQNFGRELVFSADLCYNGANEKPLPLGEVAAKPTERVR